MVSLVKTIYKKNKRKKQQHYLQYRPREYENSLCKKREL